MNSDPAHVSADEFRALFREVSNWARWGEEDQRGALHHLTPERVAAAAGLAREGITVTLSLPLATPHSTRSEAWACRSPPS